MSRASGGSGSGKSSSVGVRGGSFPRRSGTRREAAGGGGSRVGRRGRSPAGSAERQCCRICAPAYRAKLESGGWIPSDDGGGRAEAWGSSWCADDLREGQADGKRRRPQRMRGRSSSELRGSSAKRLRRARSDLLGSSPSSSTGKRPMGRDATKAARKKASSSSAGSSEYASKMHDLSIEKIALFKDTEVERKARLDEMLSLEKAKVEDAREYRRTMLELERERLAMDRKRLQMEEDKKAKEEEERIMGINLDGCTPYQRVYYQSMQEEIIERMNARRRGSSQ